MVRTIKVVVIGSSSTGKTSLRTQYISERFSTGYRATIGTDFITKTLPHPYDPNGEPVTLQIWDTAGQERFSSLSSAFFRGADAVIMVFDVTRPATLEDLRKWWIQFSERAPVPEEEAADFCTVMVGNKVDIPEPREFSQLSPAGGSRFERVTEGRAEQFARDLIPISGSSDSETANGHASSSTATPNGHHTPEPSPTIEINPSHALSRSTSAPLNSSMGGTMTTTRTSNTIYHTPSSSLFDNYESAPSSLPSNHTTSPRRSLSLGRAQSRSRASTSSNSPTITPSLFTQRYSHDEDHDENFDTRPHINPTNATTNGEDPIPSPVPPPPPDKGIKLLFASAKTGQGVPDIFEYIAGRVVARWEWDERGESERRRGVLGGEGDVVESRSGRFRLWRDLSVGRTSDGRCCSS
ncbi:ras-domain-containing protein [Sistotremastrum niveocremeum HHB9708]|uniref:Ras-domain-containing protein n=1 Tax=Sistotremastrum niveocremeum HHB9708 TaxID=1314777 RepID=A0A164SQN5_9AGAM|nr:ras-domain-containing protein [Sistotremastrum niveocremeum HHB9708]